MVARLPAPFGSGRPPTSAWEEFRFVLREPEPKALFRVLAIFLGFCLIPLNIVNSLRADFSP
ncbi:hypothetical protein SODALDRAFT_151766 [Sodiomyces alkalinus F11]|uniref:Uncharacterized protein n=1 Tax=Sodiomyces alkalinus (strain CBS 110278 / VKM F-3762 / F11) TaxID=1314773 RepID=A0A3N2PX17_SODAK|nr:hypothetical protein SODALDRAFT_151766 [Sodiomyces alkalinus F11]ROT39079.1 hypothetical protein SODALDRAFT_151766 [Sodiomyces alkalinus F11]